MKTPEEVINRLKAGNTRFQENKLLPENQDKIAREKLLAGQDPYAIILSCADSRVVPELIFNTGIGELFVVRVAGNVANTSSVASMEYAVAHLNATVLIVLGHQNCGAVTAAVGGGDNGENLNHLLNHISPAVKHASDDARVDEVIRKNVLLTANELINSSTIIADAVKKQRLRIVPAYYHLDSGKVDFDQV